MEEEVAVVTEAVASGTSVISGFFAGLGLASISPLLSAIVIFIICLIVIKVLTRLLDKLMAKSRRTDETVKRFMSTAVKVALWALAIVIIAGALGIPTASLVAVISIAGLALSLSVQNILANLFSGITLLLNRPFAAGDYVEAAGKSGGAPVCPGCTARRSSR